MPYVTPGDVTSGTIGTSAWGNLVGNATDFLANPPACRVYHNAAQSINDATETTVVFNSERFDTDSMHSTSVNTGRITCNTAGLYLLTFTGEWATAGDYAHVYAVIRVNGTTPIAVVSQTMPAVGGVKYISLTTVWKMAVADYAEVRFYQDNTASAARNLIASAGYQCEFAAAWVGLG